MIYVVFLAFCVIFLELVFIVALPQQIRLIAGHSQEALGVLASKTLTDDEKETLIRGKAWQLGKATSVFLLKFVFICIILYLLFFLLTAAYPDLKQPLLHSFQSPVDIIVVSVCSMVYLWIRNAFLSSR